MIDRTKDIKTSTRRDMLRIFISALCAGVIWFFSRKKRTPAVKYVWQLDPEKCIQCGKCGTECVLSPSAVKCVHSYAICGYCDLCGGYHVPGVRNIDTAAESQLCPTSAIQRTFIEDPFYEYTIDEDLCIGCAKCVKGCASFGNGSLYLQVRHDRCVNCNECSIAAACPSGAFSRVQANNPYILKEGVRS